MSLQEKSGQNFKSIIDEVKHHTEFDPHKGSSSLSDIILGGQDGLVNVLGIVLGVAAATADAWVVIVAGLAATFAEIDLHGRGCLYLNTGRCRFLRE